MGCLHTSIRYLKMLTPYFTCVHPVRGRMGGMHRYMSKSCAKDICTDGCVPCATELPNDFRITHWHGFNESKAICRYSPISWHWLLRSSKGRSCTASTRLSYTFTRIYVQHGTEITVLSSCPLLTEEPCPVLCDCFYAL